MPGLGERFVVFEGIDGSGKGTQMELLKNYIAERGIKNAVFTFEHTRSSPWSDKIEEIVHRRTAEIPMKDLQLLYILDRKDHIEKLLKPALAEGKTVFCNRYFLSTLAYGSLDKTLHWKTLWSYHKEIIGEEMILPAKTIFFDVSPENALERIEKRKKEMTIFENLGKLREEREHYLSIGSHFDGFEVIDANGTPEEIFLCLKESLKDFLA